MIEHLKRLVVANLASPIGFAVASYAVFLLAWVFPPAVYTYYVHEPDLMFLEPLTFTFYTLCVAFFVLGCIVVGRHTHSDLQPGKISCAWVPILYIIAPLAAGAFICAIYLALYGQRVNFVSLLASQQGEMIKLAGNAGQTAEGKWAQSVMFLTAALYWAAFRSGQLTLSGFARTAFRGVFFLAVGIDALTCIATVDRTSLMPAVIGLPAVLLFRKSSSPTVSLKKIVVIPFFSALATIALFLLLSFFRGSSSTALVTSLLGYSIVSYNRLAALLLNVMHYLYQGKGTYLIRYLVNGQSLNSIFPIQSYFGWPTEFELWKSEFLSTYAAGLNSTYIWSGMFGYLYSDIAWATPIYLLLFGMICGYLWSRFRAGKLIGITLYPWAAFCIIFWLGWNAFFDRRFVSLCEASILLGLYDALLLRKSQHLDAESSSHS